MCSLRAEGGHSSVHDWQHSGDLLVLAAMTDDAQSVVRNEDCFVLVISQSDAVPSCVVLISKSRIRMQNVFTSHPRPPSPPPPPKLPPPVTQAPRSQGRFAEQRSGVVGVSPHGSQCLDFYAAFVGGEGSRPAHRQGGCVAAVGASYEFPSSSSGGALDGTEHSHLWTFSQFACGRKNVPAGSLSRRFS